MRSFQKFLKWSINRVGNWRVWRLVLWAVKTLFFQAEPPLGPSFEAKACRGELGKREVRMLSECPKPPSPAAARARGGACSCGVRLK